jgi:hypothetical protein
MRRAASVRAVPSEPPAAAERAARAAQRTGFWTARAVGAPEARPGEPAPAPVVALLGDKRDPGYWSTARMVLEAGLTLALEVCCAPGAAAPRLPSLAAASESGGMLGWVGSTHLL